jgi:uncharacterized protein
MVTKRFPVTFENNGQMIFGVLHQPVQPSPAPAVVILHGFVGSKDNPHRMFVKLAQRLAESGYAALRIDFRGCGDSEGESEDRTGESDISDARKALDFLEAQPGIRGDQLGIIGLSWGGAVAAYVAGNDQRIRNAVLWNTPDKARRWDAPYREINGKQVIEVWGNLVSRELHEAACTLNPIDEVVKSRAKILIVQSTEDEEVPAESAHNFDRVLSQLGIQHEIALVEGADHALMRYDWEQDAIGKIVGWYQRMGA